jgi:uncharacterized protein
MADPAHLQRSQHAFAAHIRDPLQMPPPADVEDRRMGIYRELFFNNVEGFLSDSLPVLRKILTASAWQALVRDFYARHAAHSPYFRDIPREFLRYLDDERGEQAGDPSFLRELAHYEWVEQALLLHEDPTPPAALDADGDLLAGRPLLSPLAWALCYRFPVQRIAPDFQPTEAPAQPTYLLAYRDAQDEVRFIELNPVSARLFELLRDGSTGARAVDRIAEELQHPRPDQVQAGGRQIMEDWRDRGIILGTH